MEKVIQLRASTGDHILALLTNQYLTQNPEINRLVQYKYHILNPDYQRYLLHTYGTWTENEEKWTKHITPFRRRIILWDVVSPDLLTLREINEIQTTLDLIHVRIELTKI
jgi:hypothetical protein